MIQTSILFNETVVCKSDAIKLIIMRLDLILFRQTTKHGRG